MKKKVILTEETQNIDKFIEKLEGKFPQISEYKDRIIEFIENSDCHKIEFANFSYPAYGMALHNGVLINNMILSHSLPMVLFIIFHEIAHQYQFKKYGDEEMYKCYVGDVTLDEAAEFMKKTEMVADRFASLKVRQLMNSGYLDTSFVAPQMYKNVPISQLKTMIGQFRQEFERRNVTSPDEIAAVMYNKVKSNL